MKKLFIAFALTSALFSYKNETTAQTIGKPGSNITDSEGNSYKTVTIGTQTWMAENLKTSKYNDGTPLPNVKDSLEWSNLTSGAWCYFNNDEKFNAKYGKLYNWFAVSPTTNGSKNICPTGWHVPTDAEWTVLTDYLGGKSVAGGKMKEVGTTKWSDPDLNANNVSLFTGLPGGQRDRNGDYYSIGYYGFWWSSSEYSPGAGNCLELNFTIGNNIQSRLSLLLKLQALMLHPHKRYGSSVRCLRD